MSDPKGTEVGLYVLPTEQGMPPRAWIGPIISEEDGMGRPDPTGAGAMLTWSRDLGFWVGMNGAPVPPDVNEAATAHAKALGVEW